MRLRWFRKLKASFQVLVCLGCLSLLFLIYIPVSKFIKPVALILFSPALKAADGLSVSAAQLLNFYDLSKENESLRLQASDLSAKIIKLEETQLENQRLRNLLSLSQKQQLKTQAALLISRDSSNWSETVLVNKGAANGIKIGMSVAVGENLAGKVIEVYPRISKISLLTDFNSKVPAIILRTREEGVVFSEAVGGKKLCRIKYVYEVEVGDKVISSGLGAVYPKGLLIGEVRAVGEGKDRLYKIAEVEPAVDFSRLEEVMIITGQ